MHWTGAILFFWAAGLLGHIVLLIVLVAKKRATVFPVFTALIAANICNAVVLYSVAASGAKRAYLVAYFSFAVLDVLLQLSVTYELARHIFRPTGVWAPDVHRSFVLIVLAGFPIALLLALLPLPPEKTLLALLLDRLNIFVAALQCELFVGMIAASAIARLPWKTHVARIAQGLGFYSLISLVVDAGHSTLIRNSGLFHTLTFVRMTAYLVCQTYWIVMLWREAPAPKELPEEMSMQLFTLQRRLEYDLRRLRALK
jgi:hypothetical protein